MKNDLMAFCFIAWVFTLLLAPQTPGVKSIAFMLLKKTYCSLVIVECKWQPDRLDVANIDLVLAKWMQACPRYLHCATEN